MSENHHLSAGVAIALCCALLLATGAILLRVDSIKSERVVAQKLGIFPFCVRGGNFTECQK